MSEYGYNIFPYANVQSFPLEEAKRFFQQIDVGMSMKKTLAYKYDIDGTEEAKYKCSWYFKEILAIKNECGRPYMKGCNDDQGNSWVAGIIAQRIRMTKLEEGRFMRDADAKKAVRDEPETCKERAYENGIETKNAREREVELVADRARVAYFDELRRDTAFQNAKDEAAELAKIKALKQAKLLKLCKKLDKKENKPEVKLIKPKRN
jgi:hypothetical protein